MTELNDSIMDTLFLSGYDLIKDRKMLGTNKIIGNAGSSLAYNYGGKKLVAWLSAAFIPGQWANEARIVGKFIGIPALESIIEQYLTKAGKTSMKDLLMKSVIALGAEEIYKTM